VVTRGVVEGRILAAPRGRHGFGYDPLFFYEPFGTSLGEAPALMKNQVSHRGQAFRAMALEIAALLDGRSARDGRSAPIERDQ
jgi:XTP/dITP diphosphohydrolase